MSGNGGQFFRIELRSSIEAPVRNFPHKGRVNSIVSLNSSVQRVLIAIIMVLALSNIGLMGILGACARAGDTAKKPNLSGAAYVVQPSTLAISSEAMPASAPLPQLASIPDAELWLLAAQLLEELSSSGGTIAAEEGELLAPPNEAPDNAPSVEFDTSIKCHSSSACATLTFATIQHYQMHLMSHANSPSSRRQSKTSRAPRHAQRLQQQKIGTSPLAARRGSLALRAPMDDRRQSLPSRMAALSLSDRRHSSAYQASLRS